MANGTEQGRLGQERIGGREATRTPRLSYTFINNFIRLSPADALRLREFPPEPTREQIQSQRMHQALLEPEAFATAFARLPDLTGGMRRQDGKPARKPRQTCEYARRLARWRAAQDNRIPLGGSEWDLIWRCVDVARKEWNPDGGHRELSVHWNWLEYPWKCRIDAMALSDGRAILVDYKFVRDTSRFATQLFQAGHHRQAAIYRQALRAHGYDVAACWIVAVEKTGIPEHAVAAPLDQAALELGLQEVTAAVEQLKDCTAFEHWPGYQRPATFTIPDSYFARSSPFHSKG
jgi:hypothetical protein